LNGEYISGKRGGPVRMVVPEAYGFKSVKWLQRVLLTNEPGANDTYRLGNNDLDSPMKTFARFLEVPATATAGQAIPIRGIAQVGVSGLAKVQFWVHPRGVPLPDDDPHFRSGDWHDAEILPPPRNWGGALSDGRQPDVRLELDEPSLPSWPLRYTVVHWAAELAGLTPGGYDLRCRSIDHNGIAQPMPRPFAKGGRSEIQTLPLEIEAT